MSIAYRRYLQGAALLIVTGMIAGCSSGTQRFTDSFYTGATPSQQQSMNQQPVYQQMPPATNQIQSSELPPVATQPVQQTQMASAGQALGSQPQNLGTLHSTQATASSSVKSGRYIVQSGDTLYSVSRKTGANVSDLKQANGLTNGGIRVGQSLIVPAGNTVASNKATPMTPKIEETKTTHVAVLKQSTAVAPKVETSTSTIEKPVASTATKVVAEPAVAKGADATMQQAEQVAVVAPQATGISKMRWPVQGRILSSFGQKEGTATNDGVDIMVPEGSSVKAAENGVVIYAGDGLKDFGNTVLVRHENNIVTVYGHNSKILVQRGQKVRRGDEIAKSGMSGNASTPRVHFEVRKNSSPVNPVKYLEN